MVGTVGLVSVPGVVGKKMPGVLAVDVVWGYLQCTIQG